MDYFDLMGFSGLDGFLLLLCACAGAGGATVDYTLRRDDFLRFSAEEKTKLNWKRTLALFGGRVLVLGVAAGAFVWLTLHGSLVSNSSAYAKLLLVSAWSGFTAPQIGTRLQRRQLP